MTAREGGHRWLTGRVPELQPEAAGHMSGSPEAAEAIRWAGLAQAGFVLA